MSTILETLKKLMQTGIYVALFAALALNLPAINAALGLLIDRVSNVSSVSVGGVALAFDESSVAAKLTATDLSISGKSRVYQLIRKLDAGQFERLIYVNDLANLCEYEKPTAEMRQQVATDYQLNENGLTTITKSADLREQILRQIAKRTAAGQPSDIGNPLSCYYMALTDTGRDVTTALVKTFGDAFGSHRTFAPHSAAQAKTQAM